MIHGGPNHGSGVHKYNQQLASYAAYSAARMRFFGVSNKKEVCTMEYTMKCALFSFIVVR